jgi:hypothetical protein
MRTLASRSTAMPTACRWWTRPGALYNGDELLYLAPMARIAAAARGCQRSPQLAGVVGTLMTNMAVELALQGRQRLSTSCGPR